MKIFTMAESYVWYCDWCDSKNLTPWVKTSSGKVNCGACHKEHSVAAGDNQETTAQYGSLLQNGAV